MGQYAKYRPRVSQSESRKLSSHIIMANISLGINGYFPANVQKRAELFTLVIEAWNFAEILFSKVVVIIDMDPTSNQIRGGDVGTALNGQHENEADHKMTCQGSKNAQINSISPYQCYTYCYVLVWTDRLVTWHLFGICWFSWDPCVKITYYC